MKPIVIISAFVMLVFSVGHADAVEQSYKHPNGRDCVDERGSELREGGHVYIHFENICAREFSIKIYPSNDSRVRGTGIGRGSVGSPAKISITCEAKAGCETGEWEYQ